jgi:hypothetical protein
VGRKEELLQEAPHSAFTVWCWRCCHVPFQPHSKKTVVKRSACHRALLYSRFLFVGVLKDNRIVFQFLSSSCCMLNTEAAGENQKDPMYASASCRLTASLHFFLAPQPRTKKECSTSPLGSSNKRTQAVCCCSYSACVCVCVAERWRGRRARSILGRVRTQRH